MPPIQPNQMRPTTLLQRNTTNRNSKKSTSTSSTELKMGNCAFSGYEELADSPIKVVTFNGGVMELHPPVTAECITNGFPGHGIFRSQGFLSPPLLHSEQLSPGELYYLRPTGFPLAGLPSLAAPYRVSSEMDMFAKRNSSGVWKAKLVISPSHLNEILAQEARTEMLIESMRTVAKCGVVAASRGSEQWRLASSRRGSSESMG